MTDEEFTQKISDFSPTDIATGLLNLELMRTKAADVELDSLKLSDAERRKRFGTRIKLLRQALGLKQEQLAEKLNLTPQALSVYESGRREPSLKNLIALSRALETTPNWLLGEPPPKK